MATDAKPEDFHLLGTHSCKTTVLGSAASASFGTEAIARTSQVSHQQIGGSIQPQRYIAGTDVTMYSGTEDS